MFKLFEVAKLKGDPRRCPTLLTWIQKNRR